MRSAEHRRNTHPWPLLTAVAAGCAGKVAVTLAAGATAGEGCACFDLLSYAAHERRSSPRVLLPEGLLLAVWQLEVPAQL